LRENTSFILTASLAALTRAAHLAGYLSSPLSELYYRPVLAAARFADEAQIIAHGQVPSGAFAFADPGYAYILAASLLTGTGFAPVLGLQLICGVLTALMVCKLALTAGARPSAAFAAAAVFVLYAPQSFYELTLLSVSFAGALVTGLILLSTWNEDRWGPVRSAGAGLIPGLLAGLRPQMFPLMLLPLASMMRKRAWGAAALCIVSAAVPMLLLASQQEARGGDFSPFATSLGFNLFIGHNPDADGFSPAAPSVGLVEDMRRDIHQVAEDHASSLGYSGRTEADRYYLGQALSWIGSHPARTLELAFVKLAAFFGFAPFDSYYDVSRVNRIGPALAFGLPRWAVIGFFCLGLMPFAIWGRRRIMLLFPVVLCLCADMLSNHTERYWLPVLPVQCAVAGAGISLACEAFRRGRRARACIACATGLVLAVPAVVRPVVHIPEGLYQQSLAVRAYQLGRYGMSLDLFERSAVELPPGSYAWVISHQEAARISAALGDQERAGEHLDALRAAEANSSGP